MKQQSIHYGSLEQKLNLANSQMKLFETSGEAKKDKTIEGKENIDALKQNIMAEVNLLLSTKLAEATKANEENLEKSFQEALDKKLKPIEAKLQEVTAQNQLLKQREEELNSKIDELVQSVSTVTKSATEISQEKLGRVPSLR